MASEAKITFYSGAGTVTGANFMLEADGKKILVDCGLVQSTKVADEINWTPFAYDPASVDFLFITHSHIDHIGRIPKLVVEGFRGKIYSTLPTKVLSLPMLEDAGGILAKNIHFNLEEAYSEERLRHVFSLWLGFDYGFQIQITDNLSATFRNAGHILGSAMVEFVYNDKKILFTGDLGNSPSPLLPDTEVIRDADYLVMESVYGDRNHESRDDRRELLEEVIEDNFKRKGTLIIPTFSLERSQELLFELNELVENNRIPTIPIFLDSPLAIRLTEVFKQFKEYLNKTAQAMMVHDKYLFDFPGLHSTLRSEESKMIRSVPSPKVVIAGSGMSSGGRIVFHEKEYLPDPNNTLLLIGYQSLGTPGRLIQEGVKKVRIFGEEVDVRARVVTINGYSGHADSDSLLNFVNQMHERVQKVFVVMGEPKAAQFLVQKIRDNYGISAFAPEAGDTVSLIC